MATTCWCDCCLKEVPKLHTLSDDIAPPHMSEVCDDCLKALDEAVEPVRKRHTSELVGTAQEFLIDRRAELT